MIYGVTLLYPLSILEIICTNEIMVKKGHTMTAEHKRKISESHKSLGDKHWAKRLDVRKKMSESGGTNKHWLGKKRPNISGKNHYRWAGKTGLMEQVRKCFEYRQWRSDVFTRDDYTCQICGRKSVYLHADHIRQFAFILHENKIESFEQAINCVELWDINNGRTLCVGCHHKIPVYSYHGSRKITWTK